MALPLRYNWRNLFVRKSSTLLTFGVVAVIVFVLTWALAFGNGLRTSLNTGGLADKLIVIKPGATGESTSIISEEEYKLLTQLPGLRRMPDGQVLTSGEVCTQVSLPRRGDHGTQETPVAIRGIEEIGFAVHENVRLVRGRRFHQGLNELIVGTAILNRVRGLEIGGRVLLGREGTRPFTVVGVFEAGRGPLESELWGSVTSLRHAFGRDLLSSVALRIEDPAEAKALIERIQTPPFQLNAKTERQYYRDIADKSTIIVDLTLVLVAFMAVGACFAVANTTYTSVDNRSREIAMLRTIGYSRRTIVFAFMIESLLVCGAASSVGILAALCFQGQKQDFMAEATWSTFAYEMRVSPEILATAVTAALLVAALGAVVPALRASRLDIITALRQA